MNTAHNELKIDNAGTKNSGAKADGQPYADQAKVPTGKKATFSNGKKYVNGQPTASKKPTGFEGEKYQMPNTEMSEEDKLEMQARIRVAQKKQIYDDKANAARIKFGSPPRAETAAWTPERKPLTLEEESINGK